MMSLDRAMRLAVSLWGKRAHVRRLPKVDIRNRPRSSRYEVGIILPLVGTRVFRPLGGGRSWEQAFAKAPPRDASLARRAR